MTEVPVQPRSTARTAIKIAVALIVVGGVTALWFSPLRAYLTREHIREMAESVRGLWYAPLLMMLAYAVGCIFAIPASFFILASGVIWGWKLGGTYSLIGGVIGGTSSFLLGRFLGEGVLARFGRIGKVVEKQVDHAGFKSLLVLRLIPLFPFAVLNYGAGVAGVKLLDFVLATAIGVAPSNYVFAYSADAIFNGTMTEGDALKRLAIIAALLIAVVVIPSLLKKRFGGAQSGV
jgi:phospholipase D1/2